MQLSRLRFYLLHLYMAPFIQRMPLLNTINKMKLSDTMSDTWSAQHKCGPK